MMKNVKQIAILDGIIMGGGKLLNLVSFYTTLKIKLLIFNLGCAISMHGKYRIATENSTFAMPENKIGI